MSNRSDPTANHAIGAVSREWDRMAKLAEQIRRDPCSDWAQRQRRRFTGIFRRLLENAEGRVS